jgi:hypothetical protein
MTDPGKLPHFSGNRDASLPSKTLRLPCVVPLLAPCCPRSVRMPVPSPVPSTTATSLTRIDFRFSVYLHYVSVLFSATRRSGVPWCARTTSATVTGRGSWSKRVCSISYVQYTSQGMKVPVHASLLSVEEPNKVSEEAKLQLTPVGSLWTNEH